MTKCTAHSLVALLLVVGATGCGNAAAQLADEQAADEAYYDIGDFHFKVSTDSNTAQAWFDRGLAMCFGFNHEEAVRCFERALAADPSLAMAYWGLGYAWGPNINNMEILPHQIAQADLAARLAKLHADGAADVERGLIEALAARYTVPVPEDRAPLNQAYADAMRKVYAKHKDDPTVAALFAESLMDLEPWQHWSPSGEPSKHTPEIVAVLEAALAQSPNHALLCHLYIHAMEASPTPEKAITAANRLRKAMPGLGHLVHMPTHIDVLLGAYDSVIQWNKNAIEADKEFLEREGPNNFYTLYRMHNYHFVVYGAMFDGQKELALRTARQLVKQPPEELLREQALFLDAMTAAPLHVLVRFGEWEKILAEPEPAEYLPAARAMRHYARALAYAATGRIEQAEAEQKQFEQASQAVPEESRLFQNTARDILNVADAMIRGEIAYRKGDFEQAFAHLREAVRRDDSLNYDEPWGWMQPARHALGALLLERGQFAAAEDVYRADLKHHPKNPWALHGLAECLAKQDKSTAAAECRSEFAAAAKRADITIDRSCYCRLSKTD